MSQFRITDDLLYELVPKAEEKMLNQIPLEEELNHVFSKKFIKKMEMLIKKQKIKDLIYSIKKVAIIFLVMSSIILTTVVGVEALRIKAVQIIKKVYEELTSILLISEEDSSETELKIIGPKYIPKDFKKEIVEELNNGYIIFYYNKEGNEIIYQKQHIGGFSGIYDTEDAVIEDVKINGVDGELISKDGINQLAWIHDGYYYNIISTIPKEEVLKVAESIR
ncbi:DUF4367 domain-containing protein [Wansuia hejianensis]|uniref:DUF4367 domain-containing protein n=1 Tax=Wansuia hejianensis TaxID=2763667 RepID=A0A926IPC3_9FIRM|nr:DUF4367 domain-containing protein [Wansuia hejianensis]MBC8591538.1 DUF4367 domain-containing protein [Wansuia hejianensis]